MAGARAPALNSCRFCLFPAGGERAMAVNQWVTVCVVGAWGRAMRGSSMREKPFSFLSYGDRCTSRRAPVLRTCVHACARAVARVLPAARLVLGSVCRLNTGIHGRVPANLRG